MLALAREPRGKTMFNGPLLLLVAFDIEIIIFAMMASAHGCDGRHR